MYIQTWVAYSTAIKYANINYQSGVQHGNKKLNFKHSKNFDKMNVVLATMTLRLCELRDQDKLFNQNHILSTSGHHIQQFQKFMFF